MMSKGERSPHVVIAAVKDDARFKAVEVRRQDHVFEVLWTKSLPADQTWTAFAAACGRAIGGEGRDKAKRHLAAVVGLDSAGVVFYRVTAPAVETQEMASIVRMQAESLLPLSPEQIEVAWRTTPATKGNVEITIAAARREYLQKFAADVQDFRPGSILLSCEGTAKAWQSFFAERPGQGAANGIRRIGESQALLVSIHAENTQVCLVQNGAVVQAAVLGMGMADLADHVPPAETGSTADPMVAGNPQSAIHNPESLEWFAQDLRTILGSFGWGESANWPVFVLSDGGPALDRIVEALNAGDLPAKVSVPDPRGLKLPPGFVPQDLYTYCTPLGLSLLALERPSGALNLFERITKEQEQEKASSAWRNVSLAGVLAAVLLVALLTTVYLTDVAAATRWTQMVNRPEFEAARQHQALLKTVARHRPDLLELLTTISAGKTDGIVLDSLQFKKGQDVTITGQAGSTEQMWAYQKSLRDHKDLTDVTIVNPTQDSKTKKIKFTITFGYKTFSRKDAVL